MPSIRGEVDTPQVQVDDFFDYVWAITMMRSMADSSGASAVPTLANTAGTAACTHRLVEDEGQRNLDDRRQHQPARSAGQNG